MDYGRLLPSCDFFNDIGWYLGGHSQDVGVGGAFVTEDNVISLDFGSEVLKLIVFGAVFLGYFYSLSKVFNVSMVYIIFHMGF